MIRTSIFVFIGKYYSVLLGFVILVITTSVVHAGIDLKIELSSNSSGGYEVDITNLDDGPIEIKTIVVNRKHGNSVCTLRPVHMPAMPEFGAWFARSDALLKDIDLVSVPFVKLSFGDRVTALLFRACGELLELELMTNQGKRVYKLQ